MRFIPQESLLTLWCFQTHRSCRPQIASSYKFFTPLPNFVTLMVLPLSLFLSFSQREQHPSWPLEILTLYSWIVLAISNLTRQLPSPIQLLNSLSTVMYYYYSLVRNIQYRFKSFSPISSSSSTVQLCSKLLLQLPLFSFLFSIFKSVVEFLKKNCFFPPFCRFLQPDDTKYYMKLLPSDDLKSICFNFPSCFVVQNCFSSSLIITHHGWEAPILLLFAQLCTFLDSQLQQHTSKQSSYGLKVHTKLGDKRPRYRLPVSN